VQAVVMVLVAAIAIRPKPKEVIFKEVSRIRVLRRGLKLTNASLTYKNKMKMKFRRWVIGW
jgi:hypothetical protein